MNNWFKQIRKMARPDKPSGGQAGNTPAGNGAVKAKPKPQKQAAKGSGDAEKSGDAKKADTVKKAAEAKNLRDAKKADTAKKAAEAKNLRDAKKADIVKKAAEAKNLRDAKKADTAKKAAEAKNLRDAKKADTVKKAAEAKNLRDAKKADKADKTGGKKEKKPWSRKKKIIFACLAAILTALIVTGAYAMTILANPLGEFESVAQQMTPAKTQAPVQQTDGPTPTVDPYAELVSKADFGLLDKIVNIMLIGVDYAEERDAWKSKNFHADVMIVIAINTETKKVDMISLPRDTYAKIPGVSGIYKLNASIDCGGGWPTESGFEKVCEAATWMLGGEIPVKYYYAVDMAAVKQLVDQIGGIDFEIDFPFKIQGRTYEAGLQHMNGQAVLDYLRVRKGIPAKHAGDLQRIDRQKNMLKAIFEKIKKSDLIFRLPEMLDAFEGNYFTNTTFGQTAGLAAFLYNVNVSDIDMHSMDGHYHNVFNWRFVITDQKRRVKLINDIYGENVPAYTQYAASAVLWKWEQMQADVIVPKSKPVLAEVKPRLDADALLPEYVEPDPAVPVDPDAYEGPFRQYGSSVWEIYNRADAACATLFSLDTTEALSAANLQLKADIETLCSMFGIAVPNWRPNYEKETNQIYVNFN